MFDYTPKMYTTSIPTCMYVVGDTRKRCHNVMYKSTSNSSAIVKNEVKSIR